MERRTQPRSTRLFLFLCAGMLVLAMVTQQSWAAGVRGAAKGALAPLEGGMMTVAGSVQRFTGVLGDISALRAENQSLQAQNQQLRRQVAELSAAGDDNEALRQALAFERSFGHEMVAAQVVGGSDDGVRAGMIVASGAGLVGRVRETGPHAAIVQTLSDPQSRVNAFLSKSELEGTVIGGPDTLEIQIASRVGVVASPGEWAITSGVGGGYPRGLVIGRVVSVKHRDSSVADQAQVAWVNDPAGLSVVLVITDFTPT